MSTAVKQSENCKSFINGVCKMRDLISREALINKLKEHKDFFVSAYGGFSLMPDSIKYRVDEITNCIAEVINSPPIKPNSIYVLQEIKDEITNNSYPIVHGVNDHEMGMSLYGICQVIDNKIKECSE